MFQRPWLPCTSPRTALRACARGSACVRPRHRLHQRLLLFCAATGDHLCQARDPRTLALWDKFRSLSIEAYGAMYARLNIEVWHGTLASRSSSHDKGRVLVPCLSGCAVHLSTGCCCHLSHPLTSQAIRVLP